MRIHVGQIGCRLNYSEMDTLASSLRSAGHTVVTDPADAQVIVFNTCAVTLDAVRGSRKEARSLHAANPAARMVLTGCWATLARDEAASLPGVTLVADNTQKDLLPLLLEPWSAEFDDPSLLQRLNPEHPAVGRDLPGPRQGRTRAYVKVQDGCDNRCTFCVVTVARGRSRSRTLAEVVAEVQRHADEGALEAVLTGVHLGSFGRDLDGNARSDLRQLVTTILSDTSIRRLRLSSLEPWELADGFFDLWQQWPHRLCPHLHLPLQAGSDRQLRAMARKCTVASYRALVEDARSAIPDLVLTTDLITGFPGESEADFEQGLAFVEEMRFAHAHVFPFSARAGTAAASFAGEPTPIVKKVRAQRLRQLVDRTGAQERARFVGDSRPVLWEGEGRPLTDSTERLWSGLTDNYLRVYCTVPAAIDLHNVITPTCLMALEGETFHAELLPGAIPNAPAQRTSSSRLPVLQ
jgi:threonylcarbamoyladenosine tRNA methylthiotransferase MtaB